MPLLERLISHAACWLGGRQVHVLRAIRYGRMQIASLLKNLCAGLHGPAVASLHVVASFKVRALSRRITGDHAGRLGSTGELIVYTGHVACSL